MTHVMGLAFAGYRSFPSSDLAVLAPLSRIALLAGQNNAGKSNLLRLVAGALATGAQADQWDRPLVDAEHRPISLVGFEATDVVGWLAPAVGGGRAEHSLANFVNSLRAIADGPGSDLVWLSRSDGETTQALYSQWASEIGTRFDSADLSRIFTNTTGGGHGADALRVIQAIAAARPALPPVFRVEGIREISARSNEEPDLNGRSIKRRLLELQAPSMANLLDKQKFVAIQEFVRAVLDDASLTIDVPHDLSTIHVSQRGNTLPIENLGTGVHEVVILAAAATIVQNSIMCIEEPEVHLHPILQRKLLRYFSESTSNQYFIATHSAHLLDSELGSIFHVSRDDRISRVRFAGTARQRASVCADLGYRPSDLVQSNAIIWVEGPSDRVYLKHLIEKLAPGKFMEGTHYSIMFYGGSLLSELSPLDRDEVEEFISLRALNRYMAVVIDSDRKSSRAILNASKRRVIEGLQEDPETSLAWVTAGYTIENYVPPTVLDDAIRTAHPTRRNLSFAAANRWQNPLHVNRTSVSKPSKVAISKAAVQQWGDLWPLDLKQRVQELINLIERANAHR